MGSKMNIVAFPCILVLMLLSFANSDINQDRSECADQLVALATCLPYVGGEAKAPTLDCCTGVKQVLEKSKKCVCILIKDRDDPNLGIKLNATLAATLPGSCHAPANLTECISLLHLPSNSTDAKVFQAFANITEGRSSTTAASVKGNPTSSPSSAEEKSDGGKGKRWQGLQIICAILLWLFTSHHVIIDV